jgi:hypothetical protein
MVGAVACLAACSSSGVVLESRRGDPAPSGDAGSMSLPGDAGPITGVDSEALRSGSRVHVSVYATSGQFLSVRSAHDTMHGVDCEIDVAEDGASRCLPWLASGDPTYIVYLDADCTAPAMYVVDQLSGCDMPSPGVAPFVSYQSPKPCPKPVVHVVSPGSEIDPGRPLFAFNFGTCQQASLLPGHLYSTIPSPPTDWVSFERTVVPVTAELGVVHFSGSDGTRLLGDIRILPEDIQCQPFGVGDAAVNPPSVRAEYHCVPSNRASLSTGALFSDTTCTATVATASDCATPDLLVPPNPPSGPCGNAELTFFAVGSVVPNSRVYTSVSGPCRSAEGLLGGLTSYQQGPAVDPATFPAMQARPEGADGLQRWIWRAGGEYLSEASPVWWSDTASGAAAQSITFSDGVDRGVFSTSFVNEPYYADAACTKPLLSIQHPPMNSQGATVDCATGAIPQWVLADATATPDVCAIREPKPFVRPVGKAYSGPVFTTIANYNEKGTDGCSGYVPSKSALSYDFYELGDPVPASSVFAEIKTVDL